VRFDDGSVVPIQGREIVTFTGKTGEQIKLAGVLYIPRLKNNLKNNIISLGQLDERGCKVEINKGVLRVWDRHSSRYTVVRTDCTFYDRMLQMGCLGVKLGEDGVDERWHARYGHISYDALRQVSHQDMVIGLPEVEKKGVCDTCIVTKHRCAPFLAKANYRAAAALDLVWRPLWADLAGNARWMAVLSATGG
jgi:hypothetical protein